MRGPWQSLGGSLFVKGSLVDINEGLSVCLDDLQDLSAHGAVLCKDLGIVCGQGNGPLTAIVDHLDCAHKSLHLQTNV